MTKVVFICSLLLSLSCLADTKHDETLTSFIGEWEGAGKQVNGSEWSIRLNIYPKLYVIDYPSLVCGGVLRLINTTATSLVFKETLTYGIKRCINHGDVVLNKVVEHKARYHWFSSQNNMDAVGDLTRKVPASK